MTMEKGLQTLAYEHRGVKLRGEIALPPIEGRHPGVMVMHDALGRGANCRRRARDLAAAGYVALVTDMYGEDVAEGDKDQNGSHFMALVSESERLRDRVLASFEAIRGLPQVDPDRVSAIGFCFGGQCVLELARSGAPAASVVSFHGLLTTALPAREGEIAAKVLAITGALDPHVPIDTARGFEQEMTGAGADWQLTTYGRGYHAFTDPEVGTRQDIPGLHYDPLLDRLSWAQARAFLDATLRDDEPGGDAS